MIHTSIARRYARALFEIAGADFARIGEQLAMMASALLDDPALARFFQDPTVPKERRRALVEELITKGGFEEVVGNFIRLLDDKGRLAELQVISAAYSELVDQQAGKIRAEVRSAAALPKELADQLEESLSKATQKKVEITSSVDPSLLGGVVAQVGNFVYDGSLRTQLERMHRSLTGRA